MCIENLVKNVNENVSGIFSRYPKLIVVLPDKITSIIGSSDIYISEFVIAKVKGKIPGYAGHPKITDEIFLRLPHCLSFPFKIFEDIRKTHRKEYLFINVDPLHQIVVEIERKPNGYTEINTIFESTFEELKRLEGKLPTVFSSGKTPTSRIRASQ